MPYTLQCASIKLTSWEPNGIITKQIERRGEKLVGESKTGIMGKCTKNNFPVRKVSISVKEGQNTTQSTQQGTFGKAEGELVTEMIGPFRN